MKHIAKLVLAVLVLAFASCAHRDSGSQSSQTTRTSHSTGSGYRK